jgi:transcriptional regulator with XRE-family HTH domain
MFHRFWYWTLMLQKQLGQRIAALRRNVRLTQVQFANALNCSVDFISLVERGVNAPAVGRLEDFARVLKVKVVDLFRFDGRKLVGAKRARSKKFAR